jgi:hypothetical protein
VSAYPPVEGPRAALEREGWEASATISPFAMNRPAWVVRATKGGRAVEGRGATEAEARYAACREALWGGWP